MALALYLAQSIPWMMFKASEVATAHRTITSLYGTGLESANEEYANPPYQYQFNTVSN